MLVFASTPLSAGKSGDTPDGNRCRYVHQIGLYSQDAQGQKGAKITPSTDQPISTAWTCGSCHEVSTISQGWHFNAQDPNVDPGRPGEPWIFADARLATQLPLSYRNWPGTWSPEQVGLETAAFVRQFGRHLPDQENCLACHNQDPRMDLGGVGGMADLTKQGLSHWTATACCPGTEVDITRPSVGYRKEAFDDHNDVFLNLTKDIPNQRCYYCHSQSLEGSEAMSFRVDEDIHLSQGMLCVDCHRHGNNHRINRGYRGEVQDPNRAWTAELTCIGCHLGRAGEDFPTTGRLGAPVPQHRGLPKVHFEKMTCTACHTGPWPSEQVQYVKTARAHALGTTYSQKATGALPRIQTPVFARQADGRIAPCNMVWPAFWGVAQGEKIVPLALDLIRTPVRQRIKRHQVPRNQAWPDLTNVQVVEILKALATLMPEEEQPVYVAGGQVRRLDTQGNLLAELHAVAQPTFWPVGHDVRPAAQSLGAGGCRDCHDIKGNFFFGNTFVNSPFVEDRQHRAPMVTWQGNDPQQQRVLGWTFVFRPWFRVILLGTTLGLILLVPILALRRSEERPFPTRSLQLLRGMCGMLLLISTLLLALSGFVATVFGQTLHGYVLMAHMLWGGVFTVALAGYGLLTVLGPPTLYHQDKTIRFTYLGVLLLGLVVVLSIVLNQFPLFSMTHQPWLLRLHQLSTLLFVCVAAWYGYLCLRDHYQHRPPEALKA